MIDVDIAGAGIWCRACADWASFRGALAGEAGEGDAALRPELIPARERRRAPAAVKMAVEVMDQACRMADIEPAGVATVFGSGMGDMQITDYMCRTLADSPRLVSPTKFHNSVHNASTGYWSIATQSHSPANAISAYSNTVAAGLFEAGIQAVEEDTPVLLAIEDLAAPAPFRSIVAIEEPFAAALLLTPAGKAAESIGELHLELTQAPAGTDTPVSIGAIDLGGNFAATILPLLVALAENRSTMLCLPMNRHSGLDISLQVAESALTAQA